MSPYYFKIDSPCSCAKNNGYEPLEHFESKEKAHLEAQKMLQEVEKRFCKRHTFSVVEESDGYTISVTLRKLF